MDKQTQEIITMATRGTYRITIRGKLDERWGESFNGTLSRSIQVDKGCPCTILTCQVRDQAELLGILNQLSGMNLPLLEVQRVGLGESDPESDAGEPSPVENVSMSLKEE